MTFQAQEAALHYPFLLENLHRSPAEFVLGFSHQKTLPIKKLAQQLNGLQRAKKKLPTWFQEPAILYPPNLNLEQSSSEATALYKAQWVSGRQSVDLTGGFGVDSYYLAQRTQAHVYLEQNPVLFELSRQNFATLGAHNVQCISHNSESWLADTEHPIDWIYCDPSRRSQASRKFLLKDWEPNLETLLPIMRKKATRVLLKLSPLIDIKALLDTLEGLQEIHVVSLKNECKEVLAIIGQEDGEPIIKTVNLNSDGKVLEQFNFKREAEVKAKPTYSKLNKYLYEPNTSILKAGAYKLIAQQHQLQKLHTNTHLYTSSEYRTDWPGRIFEISPDSWDTANVISRNHPLSPAQLAKKYKLKDGTENQYFIAFTDLEKPKAVFGKRLK